MKLKGITTIILACTLLITGCSSGAAKNEDKSNVGQSATVTYPLTIKHAFGETVIEKQPEKVVTISWGNRGRTISLGSCTSRSF